MMQVRSLGWEGPLQEGMAIHSSPFLPGKSHGQRSLMGYSLWGHKNQTRLSTHARTVTTLGFVGQMGSVTTAQLCPHGCRQ